MSAHLTDVCVLGCIPIPIMAIGSHSWRMLSGLDWQLGPTSEISHDFRVPVSHSCASSPLWPLDLLVISAFVRSLTPNSSFVATDFQSRETGAILDCILFRDPVRKRLPICSSGRKIRHAYIHICHAVGWISPAAQPHSLDNDDKDRLGA